MLDRLIDFLIQFMEMFKFWDVNLPYHESVVLRLGKFNRMCGTGFVWLLPFYIDRNHKARKDINSNIFTAQSLLTNDSVAVTLKMACVWRLKDAKKFLLEIADDEQTMYAQAMCTLAEMVRASTFNQLLTKDWHKKLCDRVEKRCANFGIEMMEFEVIELVKVDLTLRLYNELGNTSNPAITFAE